MLKTYIFDIDNTLCDTWPTLPTVNGSWLYRFFTEAWRISFIPCFDNMMTYARVRNRRISSEVYFLSARHWSLWPMTYIYLIRHVGYFSPSRLALVPSASRKIQKFERFMRLKEGSLVVIDDLSFNTENGKTLYYLDVIQYLNTKTDRIRYIGKEKIDQINTSCA